MRVILIVAAMLVSIVAASAEDPSAKTFITPFTSQSLTISNGPGKFVMIGPDGKVTFSEGLTPDEAARVFWEAVSKTFPQMCVAPTFAQFEMPQH
jgi:hypothetical protein